MQKISRNMGEVAVRPIDLQFFADEGEPAPNLEDTPEFEADAREFNAKMDKYVQDRTAKTETEDQPPAEDKKPAEESEAVTPEVAEPEKPKQDSETNKAFQEMRKAREEAERVARENEERARRADRLIAEQYGHMGITTVEQYEAALRAEREAENNKRYEEAGLTPEEIQKLKDYDRITQETAQEKQLRQQQTIKSEWEEVFSAFPDIEKRDIEFRDGQVVFVGEGTPEWFTPDLVQRLQAGYKPIDAYRNAHFDKILAKKLGDTKEIAKQEALDKINSKEHLAPNASTGGEVDHVEIDEEQMRMYRALVGKNKSDAQIRAWHKKYAMGG